MLYLLLCSMVMLIALVSLHRNFIKMVDYVHSGEGERPNPFIPMLPMLIGGAYCAPLLALFIGVLFVDPEKGSPMNYGRGQIYFMLAGSLGLLVLGVHAAHSAWVKGKIGFWATGRLTVMFLAGFVGCASAYQHLSFFSTEEGGIANIALIREVADLSDMEQCVSALALVQFSDAGPITYRCPTTVLFNQNSQQPFAPWPDYVEGSSQKLADAITTIKDASEHGYSVDKLDQ